jgi:D-alanine-D-alanine ligase
LRAHRIAVLAGGRSSEHEVSVASANSVTAALAELGAEVVTIGIDRSGRWELGPEGAAALQPGSSLEPRLPDRAVARVLAEVDVVFPVLHGPFGEDGTVQGLP